MKTVAACIALLVAVILIGLAVADYSHDVNNSTNALNQGFGLIVNQNHAGFNRFIAEEEARKRSEEIKVIIGAAFLVAGIVIFATKRKPVNS